MKTVKHLFVGVILLILFTIHGGFALGQTVGQPDLKLGGKVVSICNRSERPEADRRATKVIDLLQGMGIRVGTFWCNKWTIQEDNVDGAIVYQKGFENEAIYLSEIIGSIHNLEDLQPKRCRVIGGTLVNCRTFGFILIIPK